MHLSDAIAHTKDGAVYAKFWWLFGKTRADLRLALAGLPRYIATVETSKHCFFTFLDQEILPDNMLIAIASDDAFHLGILSSQIHVVWALAAGGRLGMGNDPRYNKSRCFEPFPFPALEEGTLKQRIRDLGERLDSHRKRQQEQYPGLTLTGMYNVLEKLRSGEPLTAKEKLIHDQGLVTVLRQIHDELDAAVLEAYGWGDLKEAPHSCGASECAAIEKREAPPNDVSFTPPQECGGSLKDALLTRLVALNHERAAEEKRGLIRYLRPDYQNPTSAAPQAVQGNLAGTDPDSSQAKTQNQPSSIVKSSTLATWPATLSAQVAAIQKLLPGTGPDAAVLAGHFGKRSKLRIQQISEILETLMALGKL
ncbi:MAG: type IIL restriction-modification enzyme MmeI [Akkermansiaceae bacterium]